MFTSIIPSRTGAAQGGGSGAPSTQASSLVFLGDRTITMTRGNGQRVLIVAKLGGAVDSHPVDGTSYTAGAFGSGTQIGTGNFVVYNGTDAGTSHFLISGLAYGGSYGVRAYEFNGTAGSELYNTTTATNNPITATMPAVETYYKYNDTPFQTRRSPYDLKTISRAFSQLYCLGAWVGSTHVHAWFVSEGDGDNLGGIDRSIHAKIAIADDPTVKTNWIWDSPVNSDGDVPAFLDKATLTYTSANFQGVWAAGTYAQDDEVRYIGASNDFIYRSNINGNSSVPPTNWTDITPWNGNQNWGIQSVVVHSGVQYGIYVANRFIASDYGVGMVYSNDEFATITQCTGNPIIAIGSQKSFFYVKVHPTKVGGYWYMLAQNPTPGLIAEDHLHCLQIWRTSSDPSSSGWAGWTKITSVDQLSGRGYGGGIDISQPWDEGGKYRAYISPNEPGSSGGYQAKYEGETAFLTTNPVGNRIEEIEWTDWENFQGGFYVVREVFRSQQLAEIEVRTWCAKLTFGATKWFIGSGFLWKGQTALNGISEIEPMIDAKIISTDSTASGTVTVGNDILPDWCRMGMPHRSKLVDTLGSTDIRPYDFHGNSAGTIVGAPKAGRCNTIQPVSGGYVTFPNANWLLNASKHSFKIIVGRNNNADNTYEICGIPGQFEYYRDSNSVFRVKLWAANGVNYKEYTVNYLNHYAQNDATQFLMLGHDWDAGTLKVRIDYALDCTVTKLVDDSFTTCAQPAGDLRIGVIGTDYSRDVVGSFLAFNGANATDDHYLNNDLIGY